MKCRNCGEEYDNSLFPVCPFCLTYNDANQSNEAVEERNSSEIINEMSIAEKKDSVVFADEEELINRFNKRLLKDIYHKPYDRSFCVDKEKLEGQVEEQKETIEETNYNPKYDVGTGMIGTTFTDEMTGEELNEESTNDMSIEDFIPMSVRLSNILKRHNVWTIDDLEKAYNSGALMSFRNFGAVCLTEVEKILEQYNSGSVNLRKNKNDRLTVEEAFAGNKYGSFRNYCKDNNIVFVDEIKSIDAFINKRGVGEAKIKDLKEKLNELNVNYNIIEEGKKIIINKELLGIDVGIIALFGMKQSSLRKINIETLSDLKNMIESDTGSALSNYYRNKFTEVSKVFNMPFTQFFGFAISKIKSWENIDILIDRAKGYTLQEIGDSKNLSRERIRQIEAAYLRNMSPLMKAAVLYVMGDKDYCSYDELYDFSGSKEDTQTIIMWIKSSGSFVYVDYDDVVVKKGKYFEFVKELDASLENIADSGVVIDEIIPEIDSTVQNYAMDFFDENSLKSYIKEKGYYNTGKYISTHKPSYGQLCSYVVEKYFPDGIKMTDENLDLLREYALKEFGDIGLPKENRPLIARLSEYTVLRDRGTYIAEKRVKIDFALIEEIKEYIDSIKEDRIYYSELYSRFQGKLELLSDIDNYNYLHGVLKLYYGSEFDFEAKDYLKKKGEGLISGVRSDKIKRIIEEAGKPLSKSDLLRHIPGVSDIVFINTLNDDEDLFYWDTWQYYLTSMVKLDYADKCFIQSKINDLLDYYNGYLSIYALYDSINTDRPELLKSAGFNNENNLFYYLAKIYKNDYSFRNPHIMRKGMEKKSTKDIVLNLLANPTVLNYRHYMDIANRYKWSPVTAGIVFSDIESDYVRISKDEYKKKTDFIISDSQLRMIEYAIRSSMINDYLPLINLDVDIGLPDIGLDWNVYLLKSIIVNYIQDLRIIEPNNKDRRYEKGIIVASREKANSYERFIAYFLARKGMLKISERDLLSLLILNNFTIQSIPIDLYYGDSIKKIGEEFVVDVKEIQKQ